MNLRSLSIQKIIQPKESKKWNYMDLPGIALHMLKNINLVKCFGFDLDDIDINLGI